VVDGVRSALVTDPDGEWVQLVIAPNAAKETYGRLEIGIAANDLEKSRAFYRTFVGLEELPPVKDAVLGVTKYPFRHGSTTISVWATPGPKPTNRQLAGIQTSPSQSIRSGRWRRSAIRSSNRGTNVGHADDHWLSIPIR
jgi:hypothetical protein